MSVQTEFLAAGHDVVDEVVKCSLPVVIGGVTYYAGFLQELAGEQMAGLLSDAYGAWTAVEQGGTRFTVTLAGGVSGDSVTPGANDACVHRLTGRVLCVTQDQVLYFRYRGYRKVFGWWERHVEVEFPGVLVGTNAAIASVALPYGGGFRAAQFTLDHAPAGESVVVNVSDGVGAGVDLTFATTVTSASAEFSERLKVQPGGGLVVKVKTGATASLPCGLRGVVEAG